MRVRAKNNTCGPEIKNHSNESLSFTECQSTSVSVLIVALVFTCTSGKNSYMQVKLLS